jgi:type I restriction enzyme S subunit
MFPRVELAEIATPVQRIISVEPHQTYRTIGVRWWGEGAYERQTIVGVQTAAKQLFLVRQGDLIINKIWVRHGSVSIAGPDVDGCAASTEFPTFEIDLSRVEPKWLYWFMKTRRFWNDCAALSRGTSGKNRIKPQLFLTLTAPLPPLEEQRRIVARIEVMAVKIEQATKLRAEAVEEIHQCIDSARSRLMTHSGASIRLGDVVDVIDPNPSHRYPEYVDDGIPMISTSNFKGDDEILVAGADRVPDEFYQETLGRFGVAQGDVIFARKGKIGYARLHPSESLAMTHTLCVLKPNRTKLLPEYLLEYARSRAFLDHLTATMNKNTGVPTLGLGVIREAPLVLPSLSEQKQSVDVLKDTVQKITELQALQDSSRLALSSLLPTILDYGFRGQL